MIGHEQKGSVEGRSNMGATGLAVYVDRRSGN
jgi:hypothetical protein